MLTPHKILSKNVNGSLNYNETIENLILLVEHSNDPILRVASLEALEKVSSNNKQENELIYKFLESCVISDENPSIQYAAAKILLQKFPKKRAPILWIIQHASVYTKLRFIDLYKTLDSHYYDDLIKKFVDRYIGGYIKEGVRPDEAPILWLLEDFDGRRLKKIDLEEDVPCIVDWFNRDCFYKINNRGHIVGIYISSYPKNISDVVYTGKGPMPVASRASLTFIPEQLNSLPYLEEIYLNSLIPVEDYSESLNILKRAMERGFNGHEKKALEVNPKYSLAWFRLAKRLSNSLDYTGTLEACLKCLEIDPTFQGAITIKDEIMKKK